LFELLFLQWPPALRVAEREEDFDLEGVQAADEGGAIHTHRRDDAAPEVRPVLGSDCPACRMALIVAP
jgi:hypothetical protein